VIGVAIHGVSNDFRIDTSSAYSSMLKFF
jgi:hypothetical protein